MHRRVAELRTSSSRPPMWLERISATSSCSFPCTWRTISEDGPRMPVKWWVLAPLHGKLGKRPINDFTKQVLQGSTWGSVLCWKVNWVYTHIKGWTWLRETDQWSLCVHQPRTDLTQHLPTLSTASKDLYPMLGLSWAKVVTWQRLHKVNGGQCGASKSGSLTTAGH
jgi:hypothetical protein